jgi:molybdopterin-synthase adenylyltransferase
VWVRGLLAEVRTRLLEHSPAEYGGALMCRSRIVDQRHTFLAVNFEPPRQEELVEQGVGSLMIDPSFWVRLAKPARRAGLSILPIHSHPFSDGVPHFSQRDLRGEGALQPVVERITASPSAAVVLGEQREWVGRFLPGGGRSEGQSRDVGAGPMHREQKPSSVDDDLYSRHIEAFGREGQERLGALRVGVVGASGTGSHVCQQLIRLGVGKVVVIDPDVVERANLNRIVTAFDADAASRSLKVDAVASHASATGSSTRVEAISGDVLQKGVHDRLLAMDAIFGCTDTIASRALLNRIAIQHFIPYWDCGTEVSRGGELRAYAKLRVVLAGEPCLYCMGVINPAELRAELLSPIDRERELALGYIRGAVGPAPAVVSINGVVASLAVSSFLRWAVGTKSIESGEWVYRNYAGDVRRQGHRRDPNCPVCTYDARLGRCDVPVGLN